MTNIASKLRAYRLKLGGTNEQPTGMWDHVEIPVTYLLEAADRIDELEAKYEPERQVATQFTALIDDEEYGEQLVFRAYQDYGTTWETYDA
jgi:chloramphenicol O-acetyltransferase